MKKTVWIGVACAVLSIGAAVGSAAVLTSDEFEGSGLDAQWGIYNGNTGNVVAGGGVCQIVVDRSETSGGLSRGIVSDTTLTFDATQDFAIVATYAMDWNENYTGFSMALASNGQTFSVQRYFGDNWPGPGAAKATDARWNCSSGASVASDMVIGGLEQMKIERVGDTIGFYYTELNDGVTSWALIGSTDVSAMSLDNSADVSLTLGVSPGKAQMVRLFDFTATSVPEPTVIGLLAMGVVGLMRRRA